MKNLLLLLLIFLTSLIYAQQNNLSKAEKELLGKWSFNNKNHMMKDVISESEDVCTIELKVDHTLGYTDVYTKKGIELTTVSEAGTWKLDGDNLILFYSGKNVISRNGKIVSSPKEIKKYSNNGNSPEIVKLNDKPRTINCFYKIENNNLLVTHKKDDFKSATVFKKK